MEADSIIISGHQVAIYGTGTEPVVVLQPCDIHDVRQMDIELERLRRSARLPFQLCAVSIGSYEQELAPWPAKGQTRGGDFGGGAPQTWNFLTHRLLPEVGREGRAVVVGGYSLGGLFSLWCGYQEYVLDAVVGVSPSVWYSGWADYAVSHRPTARHVYLSLGDREELTGHRVFATVGDNIRLMDRTLEAQGVSHCLEWNPGNHFAHSAERVARGLAWALNQIAEDIEK